MLLKRFLIAILSILLVALCCFSAAAAAYDDYDMIAGKAVQNVVRKYETLYKSGELKADFWSGYAVGKSGLSDNGRYSFLIPDIDISSFNSSWNSSPADIARTIILIDALGLDAHNYLDRDLPAVLAAREDEHGSFKPDYSDTVEELALSIIALEQTSTPYFRENAINRMMESRLPDGSFSSNPENLDERDLRLTSLVLNALSRSSYGVGRMGETITYLCGTIDENGYFTTDGSAPDISVQSAAVTALCNAGVDMSESKYTAAFNAVKNFVTGDGLFASTPGGDADPASTYSGIVAAKAIALYLTDVPEVSSEESAPASEENISSDENNGTPNRSDPTVIIIVASASLVLIAVCIIFGLRKKPNEDNITHQNQSHEQDQNQDPDEP